MPSIKSKDIQKMSKEERMKKIEELKLELIKAKVSASKAGTSKMKEIRKMIARILTFNTQENKSKVLSQ
jgi:large subunit ribosomal protein L29